MPQRLPAVLAPVNPKHFPLVGCPLQVLQHFIERFGYFGEVWNKPPIVAYKTQEGPNLSRSSGLWPLCDSLGFFRSVETP